jgi:hypothetical protein
MIMNIGNVEKKNCREKLRPVIAKTIREANSIKEFKALLKKRKYRR